MKNKAKKNKHLSLFAFFCILMASFVLFNVFVSALSGKYTADFTANRKYTLSEGSKEIVNALPHNTFIKVYLSSSLQREFPQYGRYAQFVLRYLDKYQRESGGRIRIDVKDPEPYSSVEREAQDAGIGAFLSQDGKENLYFGAVIYTESGEAYTISNFLEGRREYLENDISRALFQFVQKGERKVVILVGEERMMGFSFIKQLKTTYDVMTLSPNVFTIPDFADAVMIVNPKEVSPLFVYAIDQYVMRGGNVLVFTDAYNEDVRRLKSIAPAGKPSFHDLLEEWGVVYDYDHVVGDENLARTSVFVEEGEKVVEKDLAILELSGKHIKDTLLLNGVRRADLIYASWFDINKPENVEVLFETSELSSLIDSTFIKKYSDSNLYTYFNRVNKVLPLAVSIKGEFVSLFDKPALMGTKYENDVPSFLSMSMNEGKIVAVGDSDMLADKNWVGSFFEAKPSIYGIVPKNNNIHFVLRSLDYLTGNDVLLRITNRNVLNDDKSIREKIYDGIYSQYSDDYYNIQQSLLKERYELLELNSGYDKNRRPAFNVAKEIEQKQKAVNVLVDGLKYLDYVIKKGVESEIWKMINLTVFVLPILFVLIVLGVARLFRNRNKKKALELLK